MVGLASSKTISCAAEMRENFQATGSPMDAATGELTLTALSYKLEPLFVGKLTRSPPHKTLPDMSGLGLQPFLLRCLSVWFP